MNILHNSLLTAFGMLILLTSVQLRAQQARIYGLDQNIIKRELWRMNLPEGPVEVIDDLIGELNNVQELAIDPRNDLLCVRCNVSAPSSDCFQAFDLHTGELRTTVKNLSYDSFGLEYNPVDGKVYFLELHDHSFNTYTWCLSSIDPVTGELQRFEPFTADYIRYDGFVRLDYSRGVLWSFYSENNSWIAVDIKTGKLLKTFEDTKSLVAAEFHPGTGTFLCLRNTRIDNTNRYGLMEFNPDTESLTTIREGIMTDRNPSQDNSALDHVAGRYYVGTDAGTIDVFSLSGEQLDRIEGWHVRVGARWKLYRKQQNVQQIARAVGSVYVDQLNNCDFASATPLTANLELNFEPGGYRAWVADNGQFLAFLPAGKSYTVDFSRNEIWNTACPDNPVNFSISEDGDVDRELRYIAEPSVFVEHAEVSLVAGRSILARDLTYTLELSNSGSVKFNGTLVLCFDPRLTDMRADPAPDRVFAGVAEWDIVNMPIGALRQFNITFRVPADESLRGVELCAQSKIRDKNQLDLLNKFGRDEMCVTVRASLDPNDISVAPRGIGERGMIATEDSTLAYTIRFQNIGDAPARDVVILDTLDEDLDVNTLHFGAASHDYTVSLFNGRILEFRFEGIELPGAQQDEAGSHGTVKYKVDLGKDAVIGTQIENRAGIYFDFNAPVITNTVINTIADLSTDVDTAPQQPGLELRSPSNGLFVLHRVDNAAATIQVYSVLGVKVHEARLQPGGASEIDLRRYPNGQYLIRVESQGETIVRSVAVVK